MMRKHFDGAIRYTAQDDTNVYYANVPMFAYTYMPFDNFFEMEFSLCLIINVLHGSPCAT